MVVCVGMVEVCVGDGKGVCRGWCMCVGDGGGVCRDGGGV